MINENVANQLGGIIRVLLPLAVSLLVTYNVVDEAAASALTEPLTMGTTAIVTAGVIFWSSYVNKQAEVVKSAAKAAPDIEFVVGPKAPEAIQRIAEDPAATNVVKGSV